MVLQSVLQLHFQPLQAAVFSKNAIKNNCTLPAQHQIADSQHYLMNKAEYLAGKDPDIFLRRQVTITLYLSGGQKHESNGMIVSLCLMDMFTTNYLLKC